MRKERKGKERKGKEKREERYGEKKRGERRGDRPHLVIMSADQSSVGCTLLTSADQSHFCFILVASADQSRIDCTISGPIKRSLHPLDVSGPIKRWLPLFGVSRPIMFGFIFVTSAGQSRKPIKPCLHCHDVMSATPIILSCFNQFRWTLINTVFCPAVWEQFCAFSITKRHLTILNYAS